MTDRREDPHEADQQHEVHLARERRREHGTTPPPLQQLHEIDDRGVVSRGMHSHGRALAPFSRPPRILHS